VTDDEQPEGTIGWYISSSWHSWSPEMGSYSGSVNYLVGQETMRLPDGTEIDLYWTDDCRL
jgi:hypothetical protein